MGFGRSSVNHKSGIWGKLSWDRIGELLNGKDMFYIAQHSKNYWLHEVRKLHPVLNEYKTARCYRMYETDILQYFEDGAIRIVTHPSAITYNEITNWGPVRCFQHNQIKYQEKCRFSHRNLPIPSGMLHIDKKGYVVDPVIDRQTIIDPAKKKERTRIAQDFRDQMLNRMLLGEFGDVWAQWTTRSRLAFGRRKLTGWFAMVPQLGQSREFVQLMLRDGGLANVDLKKYLVAGAPAKSQANAVRVACDTICYEGLLGGDEWKITSETDYGKVNINDLR